MSIEHPNPLFRLYRACDPNESLAPGDPRYAGLDAVRGDHLLRQYERALRRAGPGQSQIRLFAGHMGSGKTSELLRLKAALERAEPGSPPFLVLYFDVAQKLDVNDLDFPDLLVLLAGEIQQQLAEARIPGFSATSTLLRRCWDDLKTALQAEIHLSETSVELGFASLPIELRNRPSSRVLLRQAIEAQSTSLLSAVNDLLGAAKAQLFAAGRSGLVLMVDGLEKVARRPLDDGSSNTHERLFIDRREAMSSLKAHVIYTVPINIIYSARCAQLEQSFGDHNLLIPMIRLRGEHRADVTDDTLGMRKMVEILTRRCKFARVEMAEAFEPGVANYLARMTGGHPRHLMMFVQSALNELDQLPITMEAAQQAVRKYANSLIRSVRDDAWPALRRFAEPQPAIAKDDLHQEMLYNLWLFEYMNGEPWWEVNPVLRALERFHTSD